MADDNLKGTGTETTKTTERLKVLIGCTGSVAAVRVPVLIDLLLKFDIPVDVRVIATEHSLHFFDHEAAGAQVYRDQDEWDVWQKLGDPVLHIELRRWADLMVIAPLNANTLAKLATGICDNLLTCTVRAWDTTKPLLFAPAMNTLMYEHPITSQQITTLQGFNYTLIPTIVKKLACGDTGDGAMAEVQTVADCVYTTLQQRYATDTGQ